MPVIQSAVKRARQNEVRRARRRPYTSAMKTMVRKVSELAADGKQSEAAAALPLAYKAIDTAAKKFIIHPKNASRKKSALARLVTPKKS